MKKSLVALATLAATSAFAQFSIDGVMDAGIGSINYKGTSVSGVYNNGSATSQINFRGNHDLGGGMKADFRVETDWNTVTNSGNSGAKNADGSVAAASSFGNGEIRTGLATNMGRIDLGAVNYTTLDATLTGQPFGTAIGSGFRTLYVNDARGTSAVRADNALKYTSPAFNGLSLTLYNSNKQTKSGTGAATDTNFSTSYGALDQVGIKETGVKYSNGPINAVYVQLKQDNAGVGTGTTVDTVSTLAASYAFGASKVMLLNQTNKNDAATKNNKTTTVSGTHTVGAFTLMLQSGNTQNISGGKSNFTGLGADYNLNKMAAIYFRSEKNTNGAGSVNAALTPSTVSGTGTNFDRSALGLRVAF
jgi:predicted porin